MASRLRENFNVPGALSWVSGEFLRMRENPKEKMVGHLSSVSRRGLFRFLHNVAQIPQPHNHGDG